MHCHKSKDNTVIKQYSHSGQLPAEWDRFVPEGHFLGRKQLAITESASLPDLDFLYMLVLVQNKPVFAAAFQVLQLNAGHVNKQMAGTVNHLVWSLFTTVRRPKLLVSGHLFRHDVTSICADRQLSLYDVYVYYKRCLAAALKASCASALLIKDMPPQLATYFNNYDPQYIQVRNDICMSMDIPAAWTSIADYEKALKHKYAQRYRKLRQPWKELQVKELSHEEATRNKQGLYRLYLEVANKQQVRIGLLSEDFLPLLKQHHPELKIWGIYKEDALIGFFSAWVRAGAFDMFYIGFDYEWNRQYHLYFNILYLAIEQAIHYRKPKLLLGRTALDAKARLGCKPHHQSTFVYISSGFIRTRVMQAQKKTLETEGDWESKHPLKAES